jgi:ribosomal protein S18 acetylase RimI-like enzyme
MDFNYQTHSIETPALRLEYFTVPWDTEIIGYPVAEISHLELIDPEAAKGDFEKFRAWLKTRNIQLCSCRIAQNKTPEMMFLQEHDFRFVELHHEPTLIGLQDIAMNAGSYKIAKAQETDRSFLEETAGRIYSHGRFHDDARLGPEIGNRRYRIWMQNSFTREGQTVLKCMSNGDIVAYFVVEFPVPKHCHWSLVGMTPKYLGRGLAKDVWRAVMAWHKNEGIETITTGVSSHNTPVLNLYVALGFRFPHPDATYHWMPEGFLFA